MQEVTQLPPMALLQARQRVSNQLNNEVVEVGEIGLLKAGVLKRLDDDALCGTPSQASCKAD